MRTLACKYGAFGSIPGANSWRKYWSCHSRQWPRQILGPLLSKLCDQSRAGCWDADKIGAKVVHFCSIRPVFKNMEGIESQVFWCPMNKSQHFVHWPLATHPLWNMMIGSSWNPQHLKWGHPIPTGLRVSSDHIWTQQTFLLDEKQQSMYGPWVSHVPSASEFMYFWPRHKCMRQRHQVGAGQNPFCYES